MGQFIVSVSLIVIGFAFLVKGADVFVENASGIANKMGISPLIIGLTIVAFGTSLPELAVSVSAAISGSNEIAVGNVVGSNIFNLLVVAGSSACFQPLVVGHAIFRRDWPLSILGALLLFGMIVIDLHVSRLEALVLIAFFIVILTSQIKSGKYEAAGERKEETRSWLRLVLFLVIGIIGIIIGGQVTVEGATSLARLLGLSETLIGLTVVAIGTSLPELVTSVVAAKKGENEIAIGNVIGSNIFNIFCILGISSFVHPITIASTAIVDSLVLVIISVVYWYVFKKGFTGRKTGISMIAVYIVYMIYIIIR